MSSPGRSVFRIDAFRPLWAGQSISFIGNEFTLITIQVIAVVQLRLPAADMGVLVAVSTGLGIVVPALAGPVIARRGPLRVLILVDTVRLLIVAALAVAVLGDALGFWLLLGAATALTALGAVFETAFFAVVPLAVTDRSLLPAANSRIHSARVVAETAAPAAGGVVLQVLRPFATLVADAATFAISVISLRMVRRRLEAGGPTADVPVHRERYLSTLARGFRFMMTNPVIRAVSLGACLFNLGAAAVQAVLAIRVIRTLGLSTGEYGIMLGCGGVATFLATLVTTAAIARLGEARALTVGMLVSAAGVAVNGSLDAGAGRPAVLVGLVAGFGLTSAGASLFMIANSGLRQRIIPQEILAPVFAATRFLVRGALPAGALLGGAAGAAAGTGPTFLLSATLQTSAALVLHRLLATPRAAAALAAQTSGGEPSR